MKTLKLSTLLLSLFCLTIGPSIYGQSDKVTKTTIANDVKTSALSSIMVKSDRLIVVWTSGDKEVAMKMVFMYVYNAKKYGWWKDITLLVWGPSSKLLSEDEDLQNYVKKMKEEGVDVMACKACADMYKVSDKLTKIGVRVKYAGKDLTKFIKNNNVITF